MDNQRQAETPMTWCKWAGMWIFAGLAVVGIWGLAVLADELGGGWWNILNAIPYVALFIGGGLLVTRRRR